MTRKDINDIIKTLCPNDEDFEKPIISPAYLKKELEVLALEQEPCEDTISRQAAIDATWFEPSYTDPLNVLTEVRDRLKALPSAQRTGRWKVSDLPKGKMKYCSECGFGQYIADERRYGFCPNCGADMRGEKDG